MSQMILKKYKRCKLNINEMCENLQKWADILSLKTVEGVFAYATERLQTNARDLVTLGLLPCFGAVIMIVGEFIGFIIWKISKRG